MLRDVLLISLVFLLDLGAYAQGDFAKYPLLYDRQVVTIPEVGTPPEAADTGLSGSVNIPVIVDAAGNVVSVGKASGPGSVCANVIRADVVAMRNSAIEAAKLAKFVPIREGEPELAMSWVRIEFPRTKNSNDDPQHLNRESTTSRTKTEPQPVDPNKYTVKGDLNYSAASVPPPDYVGPSVNASTYGSKNTDKGTVKGDINGSGGSGLPAYLRSPDFTDGGKKISGGVLNGKAMSLVKPAYPPAARAVRASGAVSVQIMIDTDGKVFSAHAVSGHPLLRPATIPAACSSSFTSTVLQGEPVKVVGIITYNFVP